MNLSQRKLNKSEWNSIEIPISENEKNIINMIESGYDNVNYFYNPTKTIMNFLKIENTEINNKYTFQYYLKDKIVKLITKYDLDYTVSCNVDNKKISKANMLRIENNSKEVLKSDIEIFEFILLELINKMLKYKKTNNYKWCINYYTLCKLSKYEIYNVNSVFIAFVDYLIHQFREQVDFITIIEKGKQYIECNEYLLRYSPNKLYYHQKEILQIFKNNKQTQNKSNLVLYTAPTATGKTLTPIALCKEYRVIFVCAARHVGVALAKSAISMGKKIAFAFGCNTADDIRLHYFAAKTYERNRKSGGIHRVDNSDGVNVEIMICDIKSYLCAMRYMTSFNDQLSQTNNDIILFWDEPTITLDYEDHECHLYIKNNWRENEIPNIVLSSATLPHISEITDMLNDFNGRFENPQVHNIYSNECKKSIQLTDSNGKVVLPHLLYNDYSDLQNSVKHILSNKTLYRYLDLHEICKFITKIYDNIILKNYTENYKIYNYFDTIHSITMESIKQYYLDVLQSFPSDLWCETYNIFRDMETTKISKNENYPSNGMYITTADAFTLTDGPTIFIADDVEKIAKFCIQQSKISQKTLTDINKDISFNNQINSEIIKLNKSLEDCIQKDVDAGNERKLQKDTLSQGSKAKNIRSQIEELNKLYKEISMDKLFIPNSLPHLQKWYNSSDHNAFTSNISNVDVHRITELSNVSDIWKVLLLMGIGLFSKNQSIEYTEIVKEFADNQKLYFIIADGDYIYGTNYQFCHIFIGKDLDDKITQEKLIQAVGRVGRNKLQQTYTVRFRSDKIINRILLPENDKIEVKNMNKLFTS